MLDPGGGDPPDEAVEQAAIWLVRVQGGAITDGEVNALKSWIAADPSHAAAWQRLLAIDQSIGRTKGPQAKRVLQALDQRKSRRNALKLLGLAGLCAAGGLTAFPPRALRLAGVDHVTWAGESAVVGLPGNGQVLLNTRTALARGEEGGGALWRLIEGEVLVETGQASGRPQRTALECQGVRFATREGRFVLRTLERAVRLVVLEGAVEIDPLQTTLRPGAAQLVTAGGIAPDPIAASLDPIAWLSGRIVAREIPLGALLEELWRYRSDYLRVDPAIAGLPLSGTFRTSDTAAALLVIERTLPVRIQTYAGVLTTVGALG